jgi:hypothetical protein
VPRADPEKICATLPTIGRKWPNCHWPKKFAPSELQIKQNLTLLRTLDRSCTSPESQLAAKVRQLPLSSGERPRGMMGARSGKMGKGMGSGMAINGRAFGIDSRKLLGAHILAPEGRDSIQTAALAIRQGLTTDDLTEAIFPYLTTVEGLRLAALGFEKDIAKLSCCAG